MTCFRKSLFLNIAIMIMPFLLFDEKVLLKLRRRFEILFVIISLQTICQSGPLLSMLHSVKIWFSNTYRCLWTCQFNSDWLLMKWSSLNLLHRSDFIVSNIELHVYSIIYTVPVSTWIYMYTINHAQKCLAICSFIFCASSKHKIYQMDL